MSQNTVLDVRPLGFPWATQDPFIFCVYHFDEYPEGNEELGPKASLAGRPLGQDFDPSRNWRMYHGKTVPGFPYHPHSGFETVTIAQRGLVDHSDSLGAAGRFGQGDVQWMTAGKGVLHSEMFPLLYSDKKNTLELFQIWLNLPEKSKKVEPHFRMLWADIIPTYTHTDSAGKKTEADIIAGELEDVKAPAPTPDSWAADPTNELAIWTIRMEANASWTLPKAMGEVNRSLYFYKGKTVQVGGQEVPVQRIIDLDGQQAATIQNGAEPSLLLFLQGKPINEPVVQHGPFVATSADGIRETMEAYRATQFGGWPWPKPDQVHDRNRGRFAKHVDGREEVKEEQLT